MGRDINMVLEIHDGKKWIGINTFLGHYSRLGHTYEADEYSGWDVTMRNSTLFSVLVDDDEGAAGPKGLPDDISETTRFMVDECGSDGHWHSWLPLDEAVAIFKEAYYRPRRPNSPTPADYLFGVEGDDLSKYRLVFWFDF